MPTVNRESINTSLPEDQGCNVVSSPTTSSATTSGSTPQGNDVTPWWPGQEQAPSPSVPLEAGPPCSPQELQLAMQAQRNHENAVIALTNSLEPMRGAIEASKGNPGEYSVKLHEFELFVNKDPAFQKMMKTFSRAEISEALGRLVRDAAPNASEAHVSSIRDRLVSEIDQRILVGSAQEIRKAVVEKLETAASNFEKTANDPKELAQLADTLRQLEGPSATSAQRAQAEMLRGALGLAPEASLDPSSVRSALIAQAKLIGHEAERMSSAGETTLYRSLLLHSEVSGPSAAAPGSWAAQGPRAVLGRAHSDEQAIAAAKIVSAVALGVASGGMGLSVGLTGTAGSAALFGGGMAAVFNAPGVITAWKEIDHARAGVAAGTADASAVKAATRKAWIETAELVIAAGTAGALGAHAVRHGVGHGVAEAVADATLKHAASDGGAELAIGAVALGAHHATQPEAIGSKGDGVNQAREAMRAVKKAVNAPR